MCCINCLEISQKKIYLEIVVYISHFIMFSWFNNLPRNFSKKKIYLEIVVYVYLQEILIYDIETETDQKDRRTSKNVREDHKKYVHFSIPMMYI